MEAACYSETVYQSTPRRIPENRSLYIHRETPKSRTIIKKFLLIGYRYLE